MTDKEWDVLLRIHTTGRDDTNADTYRYPYEPTPYSVLERLANSGWLKKTDHLLDYGCGKGRVSFFLAWQVRCHCSGVEYDPRIFRLSEENRKTAVSGSRVQLTEAAAEQYEVPDEADRMYFFNPFSVEILRKVLARIRESWYRRPREIRLFFYYPSEEYVADLMAEELLVFDDEIS
ncbi:MAG: class I SAM-dependent methyltransferase [Blautia sp.]|nr:class I SAM-dependent methyltransferase [Blautia sp.]